MIRWSLLTVSSLHGFMWLLQQLAAWASYVNKIFPCFCGATLQADYVSMCANQFDTIIKVPFQIKLQFKSWLKHVNFASFKINRSWWRIGNHSSSWSKHRPKNWTHVKLHAAGRQGVSWLYLQHPDYLVPLDALNCCYSIKPIYPMPIDTDKI